MSRADSELSAIMMAQSGHLIPLILFGIILAPVNGQFDKDLIGRCNSKEVICLGAQRTLDTNATLSYSSECFPTTTDTTTCEAMILGIRANSSNRISWTIFYSRDVSSTNRINFWILKEIQDGIFGIYHFLDILLRIQSATASSDTNFFPTSDPGYKIRPHSAWSFWSRHTISHKEGEEIRTIDMDTEPVWISLKYSVDGSRLTKEFKTKDKEILFPRPDGGSKGGSKLSSGLVAGIILAAVVMVVVASIIVFFCIKMRRKRKLRKAGLKSAPKVPITPTVATVSPTPSPVARNPTPQPVAPKILKPTEVPKPGPPKRDGLYIPLKPDETRTIY